MNKIQPSAENVILLVVWDSQIADFIQEMIKGKDHTSAIVKEGL